VDDNDVIRLLLKALLGKTSHVAKFAENGQVGYEEFISNDIDIVLMDLQMPVMNGYESVAKIREWERDHNKNKSQIVALTAFTSEKDREKCLSSGFDDHLPKPVTRKVLFETIDKMVRRIGG